MWDCRSAAARLPLCPCPPPQSTEKREQGPGTPAVSPEKWRLLLFFFVLFLEDRRSGDGIVGIEPQQAHALGRAARLANFVRVHADHFAVLGIVHHVRFFAHPLHRYELAVYIIEYNFY